MTADTSYCMQYVKKHDYFRYLSTLFVPGPSRAHLYTLYAFNYELAKIPLVTSEPLTGHIRLTWWRDAIEEIYSEKNYRKHEITKALHELIYSVSIPKENFLQLIQSYTPDLEYVIPKTLDDLIKQATPTILLNQLSLDIASPHLPNTQEISQKLGTAWCLTMAMLALPYLLKHEHITLPYELMKAQKLTVSDLLQRRNLDRMAPIVAIVIQHSNKLLLSLGDIGPLQKQKQLLIYLNHKLRQQEYHLFAKDLMQKRMGLYMHLLLK